MFDDIWTPIGILVAAGALAVSAYQARQQTISTAQLRAAEAYRDFNSRFSALATIRNTIEKDAASTTPILRDFYDRYWSLQVEQWEYFKRKVVEADTYVSWVMHVFDTLRGSQQFGDFNSSEAWPQFGKRISRNTPHFLLLVETLRMASANVGAGDLSPAQSRHLRVKINRTVRRIRKLSINQALQHLERLGAVTGGSKMP